MGAVKRPCALTPLMPKELAPAAGVRCSPVKPAHSCAHADLLSVECQRQPVYGLASSRPRVTSRASHHMQGFVAMLILCEWKQVHTESVPLQSCPASGGCGVAPWG